MATLTVASFATVGLAPTFVAASAGGDKFANDGLTYLFVKNAGGAPITVTIDSKVQCNYGFDHDLVQSVAAGVTEKIGLFNSNRFADPVTGLIDVSYSAVTSVTVVPVSTK